MIDTKIFSKTDLTDETLKQIAVLLENQNVVAFPTETVYGLGAHVFKEEAIEKIYTLKNRDRKKSLIVHISKIEDVKKVARDIPDAFYILAQKFFPGPLTIILKKKDTIPSIVSESSTIAVRMPNNIYTLKLIELLKEPIVGTSANISNAKNPISAKDVLDTFMGKIDAIIDSGICPIKVPSTIISLVDSYKILRQGSISKDQIDSVLKAIK
ncbi:MAG: Threonylcarbamoyl-AMP synthase [Candidatus Anoxychlamydiales bacterium]|nr:Threonylcarbamoyl-AMP synthase [Candidatus Anoxychlamydiales bacterium]